MKAAILADTTKYIGCIECATAGKKAEAKPDAASAAAATDAGPK